MTPDNAKGAILDILRQAPRLRPEAAGRTLNLNEAYYAVHDVMARAMDPGASCTASDAPSIIRIALRKRIWRVTVDGVFQGDYRTQRHASRSAEAAAAVLRRDGRSAQVVTDAGQTP